LINYEIVLDVRRLTAYQVPLETKQGDQGSRFIHATLVDDGVPINLENTIVSFFARKKDETIVFNKTDIVDGEVVFELTSQVLAVQGVVDCELVVYSQERYKLASATFKLAVIESVNDDEAIESTNEFTQLTDALVELADVSDNIINKENERIEAEINREQEESIRQENEEDRNSFEGERQDNEIARNDNENRREYREDIRETNETDRQESESTRNSNEINREQEESIRQSNESTRESNESTRQSNESSREARFDEMEVEIENKLGIEEEGENSNGTYYKFSNGLMICYAKGIELTYESNTTLSGAWVFPGDFSENPAVTVSANNSGDPNILAARGLAPYTTARKSDPGRVNMFLSGQNAGFSSGNTRHVSAIAVGEWK